MRGKVTSLNVSVAVGVVLFEAIRQRSNATNVASHSQLTR
jgi:tRNA G18 (ribose-2'-O)-methylase SpoU